MRIGQYNKNVAGKKAVLTQEVGFYTEIANMKSKKNKRVFQPGTVVKAAYEVHGTGLTVFNFAQQGEPVLFGIRTDRYEYIENV